MFSTKYIYKFTLHMFVCFFYYLGIKEVAVKKLILDVSTCWNSVFYMLQRLVELSKIISDLMLTRPNSPEIISAIYYRQLLSKVLPIVSCLTNGVSSLLPKTELGESF